MTDALHINVIPTLRHVVEALRPFAEANHVGLHFENEAEAIVIEISPQEIINGLTPLVCQLIKVLPPFTIVKLTATTFEKELKVQLIVVKTKLDPGNQLDNVLQPVTIRYKEATGSIFEMRWPLQVNNGDPVKPGATDKKHYKASAFYKKLRRHLQYYTATVKAVEATAIQQYPQEAAFLKEVNAIISANLDRSTFGVAALSRAVGLSRTQLYRRLKPLIQLPPSQYIRFMRLQKARKLMEEKNMNASEAAFNVGFVDKSHFTRAFKRLFGVNPSNFKKQDRYGTRTQKQKIYSGVL